MISPDSGQLVTALAQEADYPALAALWNAVYPEDSYTADEFHYMDTMHEPPCRCARFVGRVGGEVVASASYMQFVGMYHPQKFMVNVLVHPERRRAGLGGALYRELRGRLEPLHPISLRAQVRESEPDAVGFALRRGFVETKRDWMAVLDLAAFDPAPYQGSLDALAANGIRLRRFPDLPDGVAAERAFHALFSELREDVPRSEPATPIPFEQFQKVILQAPDFWSEGLFLAESDGDLIGMTMFWKGEGEDALHTGLTGVKRAHRGQGLATALKVAALAYAKGSGATRVYTDNDSSNLEMIRVNEKLGFARQPAYLSLRLTLGEEASS